MLHESNERLTAFGFCSSLCLFYSAHAVSQLLLRRLRQHSQLTLRPSRDIARRMKLVVRVQYIGERARLLLREDLAADYTKGLIDDLDIFGFPVPHEQKPIEKSGFMLCTWHVERDSVRAHPPHPWLACSERPLLIRRCIVLSKTLS